MNRLDCVVLKPGNPRLAYGALSDFALTAIEPPLWGALLSAYLLGRGYRVELIDAEVEGWDHDTTAQRVADLKPRLVVVLAAGANPCASTISMGGARQCLEALRRHAEAARTLLFGLHPSALPERTLREEPVDFVCQGEGFATLPGLLDALRTNVDAAAADAAAAGAAAPGRGCPQPIAVPGLWHLLRDGTLSSNPRPPILDDLDTLPRPAWELLPMRRYRAHNWHCFGRIDRREPYAVVYTSLGCPFRCSFCCINAIFGEGTIRFRSPASVAAEIEWLVTEYGISNIKILDEMFVLRESHVVDLCNRLRPLGADLNIWAYARVDTVTPALLEHVRAAGVRWLAYGFESAQGDVLSSVNKGYAPQRVPEVVRLTRAADINICANYIFGLPDDDLASMQATLAQAQQINAEWANFYSAMAYPGSALYSQAVAENLPLPATWDGYSQYSPRCLPLPTRHLSAAQVLKFRDDAFAAYFTAPAYLAMVEARFGAATRRYVEEMAQHRLRRDILG